MHSANTFFQIFFATCFIRILVLYFLIKIHFQTVLNTKCNIKSSTYFFLLQGYKYLMCFATMITATAFFPCKRSMRGCDPTLGPPNLCPSLWLCKCKWKRERVSYWTNAHFAPQLGAQNWGGGILKDHKNNGILIKCR